MTLNEKAIESIVGKGENAGKQHFLLFPQCFLPFPKHVLIFHSNLFCRLQMLSIWSSLKFCCEVICYELKIVKFLPFSAWKGCFLYINPFPNKPWFLRVYSTSLLKTQWGKEKIACNEQFLLFQ